MEAILRSASKSKRRELAQVQDNYGYRAEDWAALGDFNETILQLRRWSKLKEDEDVQEKHPEPIKLFSAGEDENECPVGAATCGSGGWQEDPQLVPAEWLPATDEPCSADVIHTSQFDAEVFHRHYLFHPRPLLVKGAGRPSPEAAGNWSKAGLLAQAGERKVEAELFPRAQVFDGSHPLKMTLREYVSFLENRSDASVAKKKLHYGYLPLDVNEVYLNFSATLPEVLDGKVDHMGSVFLLGGALMGTPPHHHGPAVNSLVFGRKVWFLDPPGREFVAHEPMYEYLKRTKGAPSSRRCLQEPGDLLFVPRGWTHSTLCLSDCVAVSLELSHQMFDLRD